MSAFGNTLTAWHKPAGGIWTLVRQALDSTYPGAGYIALDTTSNMVRFDDFGGGTIPPR